MSCYACTAFAHDAQSTVYKSDCIECRARSIARSPVYGEATRAGVMTPKYRAALDRAFLGDLETGLALVSRYAEAG